MTRFGLSATLAVAALEIKQRSDEPPSSRRMPRGALAREEWAGAREEGARARLWSLLFAEEGERPLCHDVAVGPEGDLYVIGGGAGSSSAPKIEKLDASGKVLWSRRLKACSSHHDTADRVAHDGEGFVIAAGFSDHGDRGWALWIQKMTDKGKVVLCRRRVLAEQAPDTRVFGLVTNARGEIIVGTSGRKGVALAKLDRDGHMMWSMPMILDGDEPVRGSALAVNAQGAILVVGAVERHLMAPEKRWVRKLKDSGPLAAVVWTRVYSGVVGRTSEAWSVAADSDGSIVVVEQERTGAGRPQSVTVRLDADGGTIWTRRRDMESSLARISEVLGGEAPGDEILESLVELIGGTASDIRIQKCSPASAEVIPIQRGQGRAPLRPRARA